MSSWRRWNKYAVAYFVILACLLSAVLAGCSYDSNGEDSAACQFMGAVMLDGTAVADGTVITAVIEGDEYSTTTPTIYGPSRYCLTVQPSNGRHYQDGTRIIFQIDGHTVEQLGAFVAGSTTELDITAAQVPITSGYNMWAFIVAGVVLLLCLGIICFLFYMDAMLKKLGIPATESVNAPRTSTAVIDLYLK